MRPPFVRQRKRRKPTRAQQHLTIPQVQDVAIRHGLAGQVAQQTRRHGHRHITLAGRDDSLVREPRQRHARRHPPLLRQLVLALDIEGVELMLIHELAQRRPELRGLHQPIIRDRDLGLRRPLVRDLLRLGVRDRLRHTHQGIRVELHDLGTDDAPHKHVVERARIHGHRRIAHKPEPRALEPLDCVRGASKGSRALEGRLIVRHAQDRLERIAHAIQRALEHASGHKGAGGLARALFFIHIESPDREGQMLELADRREGS